MRQARCGEKSTVARSSAIHPAAPMPTAATSWRSRKRAPRRRSPARSPRRPCPGVRRARFDHGRSSSTTPPATLCRRCRRRSPGPRCPDYIPSSRCVARGATPGGSAVGVGRRGRARRRGESARPESLDQRRRTAPSCRPPSPRADAAGERHRACPPGSRRVSVSRVRRLDMAPGATALDPGEPHPQLAHRRSRPPTTVAPAQHARQRSARADGRPTVTTRSSPERDASTAPRSASGNRNRITKSPSTRSTRSRRRGSRTAAGSRPGSAS